MKDISKGAVVCKKCVVFTLSSWPETAPKEARTHVHSLTDKTAAGKRRRNKDSHMYSEFIGGLRNILFITSVTHHYL